MANRKVGLYLRLNYPKIGWRYFPAVFVKKKLQAHFFIYFTQEKGFQEGYDQNAPYYLHYRTEGRKIWERLTADPQAAVKALERKRAEMAVEAVGGEVVKDGPQVERTYLTDAIDAYLTELELKVAGKSRRPRTLAAARQALREFAEQSGIRYINDVSASHITKHMAWVIANSPTHSAETAKNKFLQILALLKAFGAVPMVGLGETARPLGMKDAPRCVDKEVETYQSEELTMFFLACDKKEAAVFHTLARAGLREQELSTLRKKDCKLEGAAPCLKVTERPEYGFIPKWYAIRDINIDPQLVSILKDWLTTHDHDLVFPTPKGRVDGHILRLCKRVAKRAGLNPDDTWLHKFRSSYATYCLRRGMDLETLRAQMGHRDIESLRRYLKALKDEERAKKVAEVFEAAVV